VEYDYQRSHLSIYIHVLNPPAEPTQHVPSLSRRKDDLFPAICIVFLTIYIHVLILPPNQTEHPCKPFLGVMVISSLQFMYLIDFNAQPSVRVPPRLNLEKANKFFPFFVVRANKYIARLACE
jgi:hypothetical protein